MVPGLFVSLNVEAMLVSPRQHDELLNTGLNSSRLMLTRWELISGLFNLGNLFLIPTIASV